MTAVEVNTLAAGSNNLIYVVSFVLALGTAAALGMTMEYCSDKMSHDTAAGVTSKLQGV